MSICPSACTVSWWRTSVGGPQHLSTCRSSPRGTQVELTLPNNSPAKKGSVTGPFRGIQAATTLAQELHILATTNNFPGPHAGGFLHRHLPGGGCTSGFPYPLLLCSPCISLLLHQSLTNTVFWHSLPAFAFKAFPDPHCPPKLSLLCCPTGAPPLSFQLPPSFG